MLDKMFLLSEKKESESIMSDDPIWLQTSQPLSSDLFSLFLWLFIDLKDTCMTNKISYLNSLVSNMILGVTKLQSL